jgi:hypothetical protein
MKMKTLFAGVLAAFLFTACQDNDTEAVKSEFTGNQSVYALIPGSVYQVSGTVTFKEKTDGSAQIEVALTGTEGDIKLPVHVHLGNISKQGAGVTALLNPVLGKTGKSETHLTQLADESAITYDQLIQLDACIKVHLAAAGPDKDIVLAAGNIGKAAAIDSAPGRSSVSVCKSE